MTDELERGDIEAVLETRRELGLRYDSEMVDGFAERIERAVEKRVAADLSSRRGDDRARESAGKRQTALGIVSVAAGIPVTIPLGLTDNLFPLMFAWAGILGVNVAHALQSRRND